MSSLKTDKNRFLIRGATAENISGKWKDAVEELVESYKKNVGAKLVSVYIEGSVALRTAIENKSDLDSFAIVEMNEDEIEEAHKTWVEGERKRIDALFPFQKGVEMHFAPLNELNDKKYFHKKFQMKLMAVCVYGKDFADEIPPIKLDKETLALIRVNIARAIGMANEELKSESNPQEMARICTWITKRIVRAGGMLVLWKGDFFTTNVEKNAEVFENAYPEKKEEIEKAFGYVTNPTENKKEILDFLDSFGVWIVEEDKKVFDII